ncbi:MAG: hypothetical protein NG737_00460 [Omnitrophica bacterium]|nr:hypothetical protein [Candidatus Omnitrophota bacterium]
MIIFKSLFKALFMSGLFVGILLLIPGSNYAQQKSVQQALASAEQIKEAAKPVGMEGLVSLDLRNIDVGDTLKFLAMKAGLNIVSSKNITGRVTLKVDNVVVKDIFDIVLRSNDLAYVKQGNIYNIMTENEYKSLFGRRFSDQRQVKVFRLQYAIPDQAFSLFDTLKSAIGRVLVEPDSGTALIMDTPESIKRIEQALAVLEERNTVKIFDLKYANAKDVQTQLKAQIDAKKIGTIKADERTNQVIVRALPERMKEIEVLIAALDKKTKQVMIDTRIIKIKLSNSQARGIEWEGLFNLNPGGMTYFGSYPFSMLQDSSEDWMSRLDWLNSIGGQVGSFPGSGTTSGYTGSGTTKPGKNMHIGMVTDDHDFDVVVNYLNTLGETKILSNPTISALNNHEARIHVGERQAYITTTTTTGQTTSTISEDVTFIDVGIKLSVTPTINDDGYVTLKIKPEISSVVDFLITPSNNKIPIVDTSTAETTVMVKDGATVIIGGMRKEEKTANSDEVPFFSRIPFLGFLFKSSTDRVDVTELLVLITPHISAPDALITADGRSVSDDVNIKEYKGYPAFTYQTELEESRKTLDEAIKPYQSYYYDRREESDSELVIGIKGEREDEQP